MEEFLSASHDVVFKALFVRNKSVLRAFLRDVLDLPLSDTDTIEILNPELIPAEANGKLSRLDLHVEMANRKFNIEMQARKKGFSPDRVLYYWADLFSKDFTSGGVYEKMEQTFSVNILGFRFCDSESYHSSYSILENTRHTLFTDKLSIHIFELPKVPKTWITTDKKQPWMELIRANSEEALEMIRTTTQNPNVQQGITIVEELNADRKLREQIRQRDKAIRDYENDMAVAKEEGLAEGLEKGKAEGLAEGLEKGKVEGLAEGLKQALASLIASGMEESRAKKLLGL